MHTKEPWRVSGTNHLVGANGKVIPYDELKEDAPRIVACVNACAGVPTETLEKAANSVPVKSSLNGYLDMKQQRDELLAALKVISDIPNKSYGGDWDEIDEARVIAKASIAKCEY